MTETKREIELKLALLMKTYFWIEEDLRHKEAELMEINDLLYAKEKKGLSNVNEKELESKKRKLEIESEILRVRMNFVKRNIDELKAKLEEMQRKEREALKRRLRVINGGKALKNF